jgi:hypothetical protein
MANYLVQVTPKPHAGVKEIVECGYLWPIEVSTERVVSESDMKELKAASEKKFYDPVTKKTKNVARLAFANLGPTDDAVDLKKVKSVSPAKESLPKSRETLMADQNVTLTETLATLTSLVKSMAQAQLGKK